MKVENSAESLIVKKAHYLCFEYCDDKHLPNCKNDFKLIVKALHSFSDHRVLNGRGRHQLSNSGKSAYVKDLIAKYNKAAIETVDVGQRNGHQGGKRLIFYTDPSDPKLVKVLSLFFDDHGSK